MAGFIIQVCGHIFQNKKAKSNFLLIVILMEIWIKSRSTKKEVEILLCQEVMKTVVNFPALGLLHIFSNFGQMKYI